MGLEKLNCKQLGRAAEKLRELRAKDEVSPDAAVDKAIELTAAQTDVGEIVSVPRQLAERVDELAPKTAAEVESESRRQRVEVALAKASESNLEPDAESEEELNRQLEEDLRSLDDDELADVEDSADV
ncbi:MAG: hypothetical protein VX930_06470 [Pseudomonadota bacterium]|nr:hypothetical protein [Pseudomonadota bacterium]